MGYGVGNRTYHTQVVRGPITKDIGSKTPLMADEAFLALGDLIDSPTGKLASMSQGFVSLADSTD